MLLGLYVWFKICLKGQCELYILNPRLTKPFSVAGFTKGVVTTPCDFENRTPRYVLLVPWCSYASPISIHTKISTNIQRMTSKWRHKARPNLKNSWFSENMVKHRQISKKNPSKMFQISEFHRVFRLINERIEISNIHSKFQDHSLQAKTFSKWRFFNLHVFSMVRWLPPLPPPPPVASDLRLTIAPGKVVPTIFFIKMPAKDVE